MSVDRLGLTGERPDAPDPTRAGMLRGLALSHVVDSLHEGVAALDAHGVVLGANEAFTRLVPLEQLSTLLDERGAVLAADQHPWAQVLGTG